MSSRKTYTEEFKREAVRLCTERGSVSQTARDLGVSVTVLGRWKKALSEGSENPFPGQGHPRDAELVTAQRELARLREENEILKKAVGIFTKSPR